MQSLILKQTPEDFFVKEVLPNEYTENKGDYNLYELEKYNVSQKDAEDIIKQKARFVNFAGMKDKNAHTIQYFSSRELIEDFEEHIDSISYIKVRYVSKTEKRLFIGAIASNYFKLKTNYFKDIKTLSYIGVPNYFDSQRFGSSEYKLVIPAALKSDFETAVKEYVCRSSRSEDRNALAVKIRNVWPNLNLLEDNYKQEFKKSEIKERIFDAIVSKEFEYAFKLLEPKTLKFMYKQFQSEIWNELLLSIIKSKENLVFEELLFNKSKIKNYSFDLPHNYADYKEYNKLFDSILKTRGLVRKDLEYFTKNMNSKRELFFFPKNVKQAKINENEAILEFSLPKGCYATTYLKHLYVSNNIDKS